MLQRRNAILMLFCVLFIFVIFVSACGSESDGSVNGKSVLEERCVECHSLSRIKSEGMSRDEWSRTIDRMLSLGAELDSEERDVLLDYLETTYP
jgi:hypothetical protein